MYSQYIASKDKISFSDEFGTDSNFSDEFKTQRLGMHWVTLQPNQRSSFPHAESLEEEFVYIVSGTPHVWINGYIYQLEENMCVGFPSGTGVAHTFINNSNAPVNMIVLGDRTKKENKCSFPINPELKKARAAIWWDEYPKQEVGPHDGAIGNLQHQKNWQELPFIKKISDLERKVGFSYRTDTEKFSEGVRLTNHIGLKSLGVWHEVMQPQRRSSWPHAHKLEEEAAILIKGKAKVWLNGFTYQILPGDCVFFKPGTGISHAIINDSDEPIEFLGIGEANDAGPEEKIIYPFNQTRNEQCEASGYLWNDCPKDQRFGEDLGIPQIKDIQIQIEENVTNFLNNNRTLLYQREAEYSLLLGLSELRATNKKPDDFKYFSIAKNNVPVGAALLNERRLVISALEEPWVKPFVDFLIKNKFTIPGVVGPAMAAEFFAKIWCATTKQKNKLAMGQKIYQLDQVIMPQNISGSFITGQPEHGELTGQWLLEFTRESLPHQKDTLEKTTELTKIKIQKQELFIWLDENKKPVSMNIVGRPTQNGISVSGVYTPKEFRKKGYASAVVAHCSQKMLNNGKKFCVLYTDNANPTSNKIYQQVGYNEIALSKDFIFES